MSSSGNLRAFWAAESISSIRNAPSTFGFANTIIFFLRRAPDGALGNSNCFHCANGSNHGSMRAMKSSVMWRFEATKDHREGYTSTNDKMFVKMPFRDHSVDKQGVFDILESSGIGLPAYYGWRSRSGCTFCFFQQKIEWVRLKRVHPEAYEEAKGI